MLKSMFANNTLKKLSFFAKPLDNTTDIHVESFSRLQCTDIDRAPSSAFAPCGLAAKHLDAPARLFSLKNSTAKKAPSPLSSQVKNWLKLIKTMGQFGAKGQIAGINNYINGVENIASIAAYSKTKTWAIPVRYFRCEDRSENYAIAKYSSLRLLGFHAERLRVVWLRAKDRKLHHAVLMVTLAGKTFVLDSRGNNITTDDMMGKEQPVCSLNGRHFSIHWNAKSPNGAKKALDFLTAYTRRKEKGEKSPLAA